MSLIKYEDEYIKWVEELKGLIRKSQIKASISVNIEMLKLYWNIGKSISTKTKQEKWGASVVEQLSKDLKSSFPNQQGFSRSNLFSMKKWFEFYSSTNIEIEKVQQLVGQIPWGHNVLIVTKAKSIEEAIFYASKTVENNWSKTVLAHQIDLDFYSRSGKAITNFQKTLPEPQSELAVETLKDPYKFDFLTLQEKALEKDIEDQLVKHITSFDDLIKSDNENPSIGLLLCKLKSKVMAEYALRGTTQPIGIAEYEIIKSIPDKIKGKLPTIEQIEKELATTMAIDHSGRGTKDE